jgi:succinoglycan biosynthesis transport protein ExoP
VDNDVSGQFYADDLARVAIEHPSFGQLLRRRKWRIAVAVTTVLAASMALYPVLPRSYSSTSLVLLQPTDQSGQPIVGRSTLNALDENEIQAYDDILSSRTMLQAVVDKLELLNDPEFNPALSRSRQQDIRDWIKSFLLLPPMFPEEAVLANVRRHLYIVRSKKSYAFQIGFWSESPSKATVMANTLANAFVTDRLANKQRFQHELTKHLESREVELEATYTDSELKMYNYLLRSGLIHSVERQALEQQLTTFSRQYAEAASLADTLESRAKNLAEMQRAGTLDAAPDVLTSPVVRDMKERLITLSSGTGTGQTSGGISATPEKLNELKQLIGAEALRIVRSVQVDAMIARAHATTLRDEISRIDTKTVFWKEAERRLEGMQRQTDADRNVLKDNMAQLRAQSGIIAALRSDADVISDAVPSSRPTFPNPLVYAVGTIFVALLLAGAVILPGLLPMPETPKYRRQKFAQ